MKRRIAVALAAAALAVAACDKLLPNAKSPFNGIDVTGAPFGGDFKLADAAGRERTLADFAGALKRLGPEASRVQLLFVTVDPQRDTPQLLKEYVPAFNPSFIGLRGDEAATNKVTRDFRIYVNRNDKKGGANYTVDHAAQSFVFDPSGKLRLVIGYGMEQDKIASDLRVLMN